MMSEQEMDQFIMDVVLTDNTTQPQSNEVIAETSNTPKSNQVCYCICINFKKAKKQKKEKKFNIKI